MYHKKWLKTWFFFFTIGIFFIAGMNYIIDPYGLNNKFIFDKFNKYKNTNTGYTFQYKTNKVLSGKYNTLMLGTSRVGAVNPEVINPYVKGKTFNFALPGSVTEVQHKVFLYSLHYNKIKNLVYGIDFMSFNQSQTVEYDSKGFFQLKKQIENKSEIYNFDIYFNWKTLQSTIEVMLNNLLGKAKVMEIYLPNGMRDYRNHIKSLKEGTFDVDMSIKSYIKTYFFINSGVYKNYQFSVNYLAYFRKTIEYCQVHNIKVWVYIPPMYSDHFDAIYASGYYDEFELFKRELVKIVDFMDFTGHNSITENKHNFWDTSHLRKEYSSLLMAKVFHDNSLRTPSDFGVMVDEDNIEEHLKNLKNQLEEYNLSKILNASEIPKLGF